MTTNFTLAYSSDTPTTATKTDTIIISHSKDFYSSLSIDSASNQWLQLSATELETIKHAAKQKLNSGYDSTASIEFNFILPQKPFLRKITIALLPSGKIQALNLQPFVRNYLHHFVKCKPRINF